MVFSLLNIGRRISTVFLFDGLIFDKGGSHNSVYFFEILQNSEAGFFGFARHELVDVVVGV